MASVLLVTRHRVGGKSKRAVHSLSFMSDSQKQTEVGLVVVGQ